MLKVRELTKLFKNKNGVKNLNFDVPINKITGFIGENGAGKTTTLKLIFGEYKPDKGSFNFNDDNINDQFSMKSISFFPDSNSVPLNITVKNYVYYIGLLAGLTKEEIKNKSTIIFDALNIGENINKKIKELSAGWKKRAIMAGALINSPKIIFFDEPTANLDVNGRIEFINLIKELNKLNVTIFITTHNLEELQEIIDQLIIIKSGEIIYNSSFNKSKDNISKIYKKFSNSESIKLEGINKIYE